MKTGTCDCCGVQDRIRGNVFLGTDNRLCDHCLFVWYSDDITDRAKLKAASLARRLTKESNNE